MNYTVEVDVNGRILIPATVRKQNQWTKGSKLNLAMESDGVKIISRRQELLNIQNKFLNHFKSAGSVDDFLKDRKKEGLSEINEINKL